MWNNKMATMLGFSVTSILMAVVNETLELGMWEGWEQDFNGILYNRAGREADNALSFSTEVKNAWSYTFTSPYAFTAACLIKHKDNFRRGTSTWIDTK
jgi:hypothetical protein